MKVKIDKDEYGKIITICDNTKLFTMSFAGNLDLYWIFDDLSEGFDSKRGIFYITKENYFVYSLFEKLYEDVSNCELNIDYRFEYFNAETLEDLKKIDRKKEEDRKSLKRDSRYKELYNNGVITWISDDRDYSGLDKVEIKKDDNMFILDFYRIIRQGNWLNMNHRPIIIRFRNHGSSYAPFNCLFMDLYNKFDKYNPNDTQMHIEECLYLVKRKEFK